LAVIEQFGRPTEPLTIATTNRGGKEKINAKGQ
jgi:hypothetical protein